MHEVAIVRGIVKAALEAAEQQPAGRIVGVSVVLGELSHISEDSLRFNFEVLSNGTRLEGAQVIIRTEPAQVTCWDCSAANPSGPEPVCPACGSARVEIAGGSQCYVESIDLDET
ncbi:MAG: hydrogenase maturation nickel metallochaperone HypA [Acidimicrobiia bacterium]